MEPEEIVAKCSSVIRELEGFGPLADPLTGKLVAVLICMECERAGAFEYLAAYLQEDETELDPTEYGLTAEQHKALAQELLRYTKQELRKAYQFLNDDVIHDTRLRQYRRPRKSEGAGA